jgi:hypothetical protein
VLYNRIHWAKFYMSWAGPIASPACCHILETGNDSFRFKNSSAHQPKTSKEKRRNLTPAINTNDT